MDENKKICLKDSCITLKDDHVVFEYNGVNVDRFSYFGCAVSENKTEQLFIKSFYELFLEVAVVVKCLFKLNEINFGHTEVDLNKRCNGGERELQFCKVICNRLVFKFETDKYDDKLFYNLDRDSRIHETKCAFGFIQNTELDVSSYCKTPDFTKRYRELVLGIHDDDYFTARDSVKQPVKESYLGVINNHQRGVSYEHQCKQFLENKYDKVYLWDEFKQHIPYEQRTTDIGIDIVAFDENENMIGIQCKNWTQAALNFTNISTFVCAGNMRYAVDNVDKDFKHLILMCRPTTKISNNLNKFLKNCGNRIEIIKLAS